MSHLTPPRRPSRPEEVVSGTYCKAQPRPPAAGIDYPRSSAEFHQMFPDDGACRVVLERLRWPRGYGCRQCGDRQEPFRSGLLLGCTSCGYLASITYDTLFHGTAKPLLLWFRALWAIVGQQFGTHPLRMQSLLELRDARSSREVVTRVRRAMATAVSDPLRGSVDVARSYVEVPRFDGRSPTAKDRRTAEIEPIVVVIAAERARSGLGRARLGVLAQANARSITDFVADVVEPGSTIYTGSWPGYRSLDCAGFEHVAPAPRASKPPLELSSAARVGEALRRWLWLTRGVTGSILGSAVDEFAFRYRYRACERGLTFYHLLRQAVPVERIPPLAPQRAAQNRARSS